MHKNVEETNKYLFLGYVLFQAISGLYPPDLDENRVTIRSRRASGYIVKVPVQNYQIGRAHVRTPVTEKSRMPSSA